LIEWGMEPQAAIELPRGFLFDGVYSLETGMPEMVAQGLARLGHKVARADAPWGGAQVIGIDWGRGVLVAGSESRKDGMALGY